MWELLDNTRLWILPQILKPFKLLGIINHQLVFCSLYHQWKRAKIPQPLYTYLVSYQFFNVIFIFDGLVVPRTHF